MKLFACDSALEARLVSGFLIWHKTGRSVAGTIGAEFALSVKIARDLVSFFGRSPQATEKLKRTQRALDDESIPKVVVKDVETRWWSKAWQR